MTKVGRGGQGEHRWRRGILSDKVMEAGTHSFDVSQMRGGDRGWVATFCRQR
jgi:hypothetical protein